MTDRDAALRLDTALDDLLTGDRSADPLAVVAATLQELDLRQRAVPSDTFRTQLRQSLFASPNGVHHRSASDEPVPLIPARPVVSRAAQPNKSHRFLALAAALLLLLGGMGAITRLPLGSQRDPEPSAIPAAVADASPAEAGESTPTGGEAAMSEATISWVSSSAESAYLVPGHVVTEQRIVEMFGTASDGLQVRAVDIDNGNVVWTNDPGVGRAVLARYGEDVLVAGAALDSSSPVLVAINGETGEELWHADLSNTYPVGISVEGDRAFVLGDRNMLDVIDTRSGTVSSSIDLTGDAAPWDDVEAPGWILGAQVLAISGETLAAVLADGSVTGVDASSGELAWQKVRSEPGVAQVIDADGRFMVIDDGTIDQISAQFPINGAQYGQREATPGTTTATCLDKVVSIPVERAQATTSEEPRTTLVFGVSRDDGAIDWSVESQTPYQDHILSDRNIIFQSYSADIWPLDASDVALCTIDPATGMVWQAESVADIAEQSALVVVNDIVPLETVFGVLGGGSFIRLDAALDPSVTAPRVVFEPALPAGYAWIEPVADGWLLGRGDGEIIRIVWATADSGTPVPTEQPAEAQVVTSNAEPGSTVPLVVANDTVYLFRSNEQFTGLSAERTSDSKQRWHVEGAATGQLAVDDHAVYVAFDASGRVEAYGATDGDPRWSWNADGNVTGLAVADGTVYAAATDGTLTALNGRSGSVLWQTMIGPSAAADTHVWGYESIVVSADSVVALMPSGTLGIVNRSDGFLRGSGSGYDPSATAFTIADGAIVIVDRKEFSSLAEVAGLPEDAIVEHTTGDGIVAEAPGTVLPDGSRALPPISGWAATGIDLDSGETLWSGGFPAVSTPPVAIGDVVALGAEIRDPSGDRSGLVGIDPRTGATVLRPGQPVIQLGTWQREDGASALFVTLSDSGMLSVIEPWLLVDAGNATPRPSEYGSLFVDVGQPPDVDVSALGQPAGDDSGIWLSMGTEGAMSVHPTLFDATIQHEMATGVAQVQPGSVAWTLGAPQDVLLPSAGYIATSGNVIFQLFGASNGTSIVRAVDLQSGEVRWERSVGRWVFDSTVHEDLVLMAGTTQTAQGDAYDLLALDGGTGEAVWSIPLGQSPRSVLVVDDMAVVLGWQDRLEAYDLATQQLIWSTDLGEAPGVIQLAVPLDPIVGRQQLAVIDGVIGALIDTRQLVTVDAATGTPMWVDDRTNPGFTELEARGGRFVVMAFGEKSYGQPSSAEVVATPLVTPFQEASACLHAFALDPADALPFGMVIEAFDPATGESTWSLGTIDGAVFWAFDDDTLHGYAPSAEPGMSDESVNCAIDTATGAVTQTDNTVSDPLAMFRISDPQYPDQLERGEVIAVLAGGAWIPISVDPSVAASLPVFDRDVEEYGGAFNAHVVDGAILLTMMDGTLVRLNDAGQT